jgi:hypothetical protein
VALIAASSPAAASATSTLGTTASWSILVAIAIEWVHPWSRSPLDHSTIDRAASRLGSAPISPTAAPAIASPVVRTAGAALLRLHSRTNPCFLGSKPEKAHASFLHDLDFELIRGNAKPMRCRADRFIDRFALKLRSPFATRAVATTSHSVSSPFLTPQPVAVRILG